MIALDFECLNGYNVLTRATFRDASLQKTLRVDIHLHLHIAAHFRPGL